MESSPVLNEIPCIAYSVLNWYKKRKSVTAQIWCLYFLYPLVITLPQGWFSSIRIPDQRRWHISSQGNTSSISGDTDGVNKGIVHSQLNKSDVFVRNKDISETALTTKTPITYIKTQKLMIQTNKMHWQRLASYKNQNQRNQ